MSKQLHDSNQNARNCNLPWLERLTYFFSSLMFNVRYVQTDVIALTVVSEVDDYDDEDEEVTLLVN